MRVSGLSERLLFYSFLAIPSPLLVAPWLRWWRATTIAPARAVNILTLITLLFSSVSWLILVLLREAIGYLSERPGPMGIAEVNATVLGSLCALLALPLALFAVEGMRILLAIVSALLLAMWFLAAPLW